MRYLHNMNILIRVVMLSDTSMQIYIRIYADLYIVYYDNSGNMSSQLDLTGEIIEMQSISRKIWCRS